MNVRTGNGLLTSGCESCLGSGQKGKLFAGRSWRVWEAVLPFRLFWLSMNPNVEKSVAAKIRWARDDGCPVAASSDSAVAKMAAIARRRWNSYERRNRNIPDTTENRINDLARGLAEKFTEGGWPMVGPLIADYRWLSEQIAPILSGDA